MASQLGPPSSAKKIKLGPPSPSLALAKYYPAATTITAIGDDLLREIFVRLPSLPSLIRAALACRTFLRAVRSPPAFRGRFRALHAPQLLGYFTGTAIPAFTPFRSRSDPDLAAAVRGSDFFFTRLPGDGDEPRWVFNGCCSGYVFLHNENTDQIAAYNPLAQVPHIFPYPPQEACDPRYLDFRIIFSEDDRRSFRVVCVRRRRRRLRTLARLSVFSSESREWQGSSWVDTSMPQPGDDGGDKCMLSPYTATGVDEFDRLVYWKHKNQAYIVVLNAGTLQLSRMDLPQHLKDMDAIQFKLGPTKDGRLCMAFTDQFGANEGMLTVWFWRADGDGVDKWMPHKIFPLNKFVDFSMCSEEYDGMAQVFRVIDDFVYLSVYYQDTNCFLSFCLETEKVNKLFEYRPSVQPYIMPWPRSLVCNKEDLETKVTGDNVADDGPVGREETPSVLVTALRSYKEALINGDGAKVAEIEAFLLYIEDEKKSLVAELTSCRDCISRISAGIDDYRRREERER